MDSQGEKYKALRDQGTRLFVIFRTYEGQDKQERRGI